VLVASIVYTGLSVPLIIAGRKNKARALALNVTSLRTELLNKGGASHSILQPALHLVVPL
jgi:hypothetical protein